MTVKNERKRRIFSLTTSAVLVLSTLFMGISVQVPNARATEDHDVGRLQVKWVTDFGRIFSPLIWPGGEPVWTYHTTNDAGFGFIGLVIDQDNYDHTPGSIDIADPFFAPLYTSQDDFEPVSPITMVVDTSSEQKSIASFENTGTSQDASDLLINQTIWTIVDKDWAILQWNLINQKGVPLTNVCLGLEIPISQEGTGYGLGGDSGDDIDGFDTINETYYAQDNNGAGVCIGIASATISDPITHYYSEDYQAEYQNSSNPNDPDPKYHKNFYANETWLYERLHAPNSVAGNAKQGNRTTTVGWNGVTINPGESRAFTVIISMNYTFDSMITAIKDGQNYYHTIALGFRITEFSDSDSPSQQIEIFNYGGKPIDMVAEGYFFSIDGGVNPLLGTWDKNPLLTYDHGVFTLSAGTIGPEGDKIGLYQDVGGGKIVLIDSVSYGQNGTTPDPIAGESVAKRYDSFSGSYVNEWLRNASSGPTWGAQNNVLPIETMPTVVINEVMFNPGTPELGFIELMYTGSGNIDIQGYSIICDGEYKIPTSQILSPSNPFYTLLQSDDPTFFSGMNPSGDNIYLYDKSGVLLDMVGWNSPHFSKMSVSRSPDGNGIFQGYNDISSEVAGWVFNIPLDIIITEISDSDSALAQIEVYNQIYPPIDLSSGFSFESTSQPLSGVWSIPIAPTNGYAVFDVSTPLGLNAEADTIRFFQNGIQIEEISYGFNGIAPDPLTQESTARVWENLLPGYTNFWSRNGSAGPTWGAQNTPPSIDTISEVVLNEVLFNPQTPAFRFIELVYTGTGIIDLQGYQIVCDNEYIIPVSYLMSPQNRYFIFQYSDDPTFFDNIDPVGDNVYLYNNTGQLIDMVGWSSSHTMDTSVIRIPDGFGGHQGYNDITSQNEGWVFDQTPSPKLIVIEPNQFQIGIQGMTLSYLLNITNKNNFDDVIDISYSWVKGWSVDLFQADGVTPLVDTESGPDMDGIPDTGVVSPKSMVQITVNVSIPFGILGGVSEYTTIVATSSINAFAQDSALLNSSTLKGLEYRSPNRYVTFVRGTLMVIGHLDNTQVKITDISSGSLLNQFTINYGETWTTNLMDVHVDINASSNVTVLSGNSFYASGGNSWMSYFPTQSGGKFGRNFYGFIPQELYIFAPRIGSLPPTSISILDESDGDDTQTLTSSDVDFSNSDVEIYKLTSFDDDIVTISSNVPISVLGGKVSSDVDWTATPPSVNGSELGKHFFVFASDSITIFPIEDNTNITLIDLSDGDDSRSLKLNRYDIYTQRSLSEFGNPIVTRPGTTLYHNSDNLIDDDYIEIISDKEILVYIGPICDQRQEFADLSPSVSTGIFSQEVFTYAQNGGANDLQVFVYDKDNTVVKITSLTYSWGPGSGRDAFFDFTLDADDFSGFGPWWWEWGGWGGNILHIQANLPISVFNGDFDGASFGSFLSVINPPENLIYPDLKIDSTDITFEPSSVINEGETLEIITMVHNIGDLNVTNVKVSFYLGNPLLGGTLCAPNQTIPYIDVGGNYTANITWLPPSAGSYEIFIAIDYPFPGIILEFDETNNLASKIVIVQAILPPELYITATGDNITLNWTQPQTAGLSHYLIYKSTSQVEFNFSKPWVDTKGILANGIDPEDGLLVPARTTWNDTQAASEFEEKEYYYTIRAVFDSGEVSYTSRTVGKFTRIFSQGISTFSLPLEPFTIQDTEYYCQDMNADYIRWMNSSSYNWVRHDKGSPVNKIQIKIGLGYEVFFGANTKYTFCGLPGAMILYDNISFGFKATVGGEAQTLSANVNSVSDTVVLNWVQPSNIGSPDRYHILRATQRDGFWGTQGIDYVELVTLPYDTLSYSDIGNATIDTEYYYMIVPVNQSTGERGSSSYSIGICTLGFFEYDLFALPLKPGNYYTADWFCENIDDAVGINYFNVSLQIWFWHSTLMPEGAFDANIEFGLGYQLSTSFATKFHFVGI